MTIQNPAWDIIEKIPGNDIDLKYERTWRPDAFQMRRMLDMAPEEIEDYEKNGPTRSNITRKYTWAIPAPESIEWIVEQLPGRAVVEIGAGTGYWAWMLSQHGVDVNAYDLKPPGDGWNEWHCERESRVEGYSAQERQEHYDRWKQFDNMARSVEELNASLPEGQRSAPLPRIEYEPLPETGPRQSLFGKPGMQWFDVRPGSVEMLGLPENQTRVLFLCWPPYDKPMGADAIRAYRGDTIIYIGEGEWGCTGDDEMHALLNKEWDEVGYGPLRQWFGIHDNLYLYRRRA